MDKRMISIRLLSSLFLVSGLAVTTTPASADGGARLTRPSGQSAMEGTTADLPQRVLDDREAALTPYTPPAAATPPPVLPQTSTPVAPSYPAVAPVPPLPTIAPTQASQYPQTGGQTLQGQTQSTPSTTVEGSQWQGPQSLPHFIPGGGLATQVQGRTDLPTQAAPQPTPSYAQPQQAPTPTLPSIQFVRPAAPQTPTPVRTTPTPVIQRFSLEQTFRDLALKQQPVGVNIWFPGVATLTNREIALGSAIAQGIALRVGDSPVIATSSPSIVPGRMNVIVGLPSELRGMVSNSDIPVGSHGRLILREVTQHPNTQLLFITGQDESGINSAILSLGLARDPMPGVPTASIREVVIPHSPPFMRREPIRGDAIHTFEYLRANGTGIYRTNSGGMRIFMNLPGDFDATLPGDIILDLHTTAPSHYASQNDRITARVNHSSDIISVPVGTFDGRSTRTSILLPVKLFEIGQNVIELNFPGSSTRGFDIFNDSTLSTPRCTTPPTLPNLFLFNRTAYPFIGQPDGSEILVLLAGRTAETIESTWTFLAKIAQASNTMFHATEYASTTDAAPTSPRGRHIILVGNHRNLPEEQRADLPEDLFHEVVRVPPPEEVKKGSSLKDLLDHGRETLIAGVAPTPTPTPTAEEQKPVYPREERGFLGCYPPKENTHGWVLLLTAETESLLRERASELVLRPFWERITGSSVYWNQTPESLEVYKPTPEPARPLAYVMGQDNWVEMPFGERIRTDNWLKAIGITLLILIVSLIKSLQKNSNLRDYSS